MGTFSFCAIVRLFTSMMGAPKVARLVALQLVQVGVCCVGLHLILLQAVERWWWLYSGILCPTFNGCCSMVAWSGILELAAGGAQWPWLRDLCVCVR